MRIYLTGFMGAGKTTVGRSLAEHLQIPFVDLDGRIEARAEMSVREIFERLGETAFRDLESELLQATLQCADVVVATGGGTITLECNRQLIQRNGLCVWLNPPFSVILRRIGGVQKPDRPLFQTEKQAFALYRQRLAAYQSADVRVDISAEESPSEIAGRIVLLLRDRTCVT